MKTDELSKDRIEEVDRLYWSPKERAEGVHQILMTALEAHKQEHGEDDTPSYWDLLCWAVEFISQQAIAIQDQDFLAICVRMNRKLWSMHYNAAEEIYPRTDKLDSEIRSSNIKSEQEETE